ncbi:solute carrier organic anion transporter family member 4A1-like protein [Leptotrombidium deliense]|uniref:Solute carrier organic anion transporter family member n=1 Tax=Leptotrombidium deliense TaxID=299467 RepID=A0A443S6G2_9ACAR|nr:solute carrier organic anion transporter family member 4A1-like protein [Leptotrombidium deliense]
MGLGALVFSSPYFVSNKYEFSSLKSTRNCVLVKNSTSCDSGERDTFKLYKYLFFCGQFLHGVGAAPLWTLGCAYIDENVSSKMSSMYLGIFYTMAIIGPGVGYIVGGQLLQIYVDFLYVNEDEIGLTSSSDIWVGAWWLGFLMGSVFCFAIALPIAALPKLLPGSSKSLQEKRTIEAHKTSLSSKAMHRGFGRTLSDLPISFWILATNAAFIFLSFAGATEEYRIFSNFPLSFSDLFLYFSTGLLTSALAAFSPKIIEQKFHISPSSSALLVGLISVPSAAGGTFIGGYIVNKFDLKVTGILKFIIVCTFLSACTSVVFLISCDTTQLAGITTKYIDETALNGDNLTAKCNANCSCSQHEYDPVCGVDNIAYFSPCYAGCYESNVVQGRTVYSNCSCIHLTNSSLLKNLPEAYNISIEAIRTKCSVNCNKLPFFTLLLFLSIFFTFVVSMPSLIVTMRCVVPNQKSFALGLQWVIIRVFGTIPAPFIFGKSIDLSCIYWKPSCDSSGDCILYNNTRLSIYLTILVVPLKCLSVLLFSCVLIFYEPILPQTLQSESEQEMLHSNN